MKSLVLRVFGVGLCSSVCWGRSFASSLTCLCCLSVEEGSHELSSSGLLLYENDALGYWVMGVVPKPSFHRTHLGTQKTALRLSHKQRQRTCQSTC